MNEPMIIEEINNHIDNSTTEIISNINNTSIPQELITNINNANTYAYNAFQRANAIYNGSVAVGQQVNKWESVVKTIAANSINLTTTNNTETAKLARVGSFNFTSVSNLTSYFNIILPVCLNQGSQLTANCTLEFLISKRSTTTTTLTGYNTIKNDTTNLIYHITNIVGATGVTGSYTRPYIAAYSNKFVAGTTYYVYFALHNKAYIHTTFTGNFATPKIEIEMFYLSSTNKTFSGIKHQGVLIPQYEDTWTSTYRYGRLIDPVNENLISHKCLYQYYAFGEGGHSFVPLIVNSNVYFVSCYGYGGTGAFTQLSAMGNIGTIIEYY